MALISRWNLNEHHFFFSAEKSIVERRCETKQETLFPSRFESATFLLLMQLASVALFPCLVTTEGRTRLFRWESRFRGFLFSYKLVIKRSDIFLHDVKWTKAENRALFQAASMSYFHRKPSLEYEVVWLSTVISSFTNSGQNSIGRG